MILPRGPVVARNVVLGLLVGLVGASSAAYGSTELWSSEWLLFAALLCAGVLVWTVNPAEIVRGPAGRLALPLVVFVAWGFVQSLPMPLPVLRVLAAKTEQFYAETLPPGGADSLPLWLLDRARKEGVQVDRDSGLPPAEADRGDRAVGRSFSVSPASTRDACLGWLTPILLFLAAAWAARDPRSRYLLVWAIGGWAAAWGLALVVQRTGWKGHPIWTRDMAGIVPALPFVNKNHFAGFVEVGTLVVLGLLFALGRTARRAHGRGRDRALLDRSWAAPRIVAAGTLVLLGVVGVVLSGSRGGYLSLGLGLAFFAAARRLRGNLWAAIVAVVVLGLLVGVPAMISPDRTGLQEAPFMSGQADESMLSRVDGWTRTLRIFLDHPIVGTGLGTFKWAFSLYERQGEWMIFREAHDDYLQALAETGLIGAALLVWALVVFLRSILVPALRGVEGKPRWTTVGAAAGVFALLVHSIVDFNLQVPSNAVLFMVVLGVLAAAARDERQETGREEAA